jgi:tetratricopeptide (TPR) repeat protein
MKTFSTCASWYCGALVLLAFCLFAVACPSKELLLAIAFEVAVVGILIAWRSTKWKRKQAQEREELLTLYANKWRLFGRARSLADASIALLWLCAAVVLTVEGVGLGGAFFKIDREFTRSFYTTVRWSEVVGLHPAATLELLAGAFSQGGNYVEAERLYQEILFVRKQLYGDRHIMRASIYADLGNLFQKQGKFQQAEVAYRQALATWRQEQWSGSVVNRLGNSLRSQGKFAEAEAAYQKALAIRGKQFGKSNYRVAETSFCYAALLKDMNRTEEADKLLRRGQIIAASSSGEPANLSWLYAVCGFAITSGASYILLSKRGIVNHLLDKKNLPAETPPKNLLAPALVLLATQECLGECV